MFVKCPTCRTVYNNTTRITECPHLPKDDLTQVSKAEDEDDPPSDLFPRGVDRDE